MRTMIIPKGQEAVVAFLMTLNTPTRKLAEPVSMVETNQSYVFLHNGLAYKLFKAIARYRNNETPAARLENAQLEMAANKPLAAGLYLGILAIVQNADGSLAMAELGAENGRTAVDYVVKMHQFDNAQLMYSRLFEGSLNKQDLFDLGVHVANFHKAQPPQPAAAGTYAQTFADDFNHWLKSYAERIPQRELAALMLNLQQTAADAVMAKASAFSAREKLRTTLHGDMDFGNIATFNGKLMPFDAQVLFDGKRENDPAKDVAYMLAPLYMYGRQDLARALIAGYMSIIPNSTLEEVLPLWVAYASMVRGNSWLSKAAATSHTADAVTHEAYGYRYLKNMERLLKGEMTL